MDRLWSAVKRYIPYLNGGSEAALIDKRFKPRKFPDNYMPANAEIVLLDDIKTNEPALLLRPLKQTSRSSVSGVTLASIGQAASSGVSMWQHSGLYEIVVPNADLARQLALNTAEFVPGKIAGLFSNQIREIGGPAIGQGFFRAASSAGNVAAACASVFGVISAIAMDMRLRNIETVMGDISEKITDMVDIELQTKLEFAVSSTKELLGRLKAIELTTENVDPSVLQQQRSDFDSRLRDAEKNGIEACIATRKWLETETRKLENATSEEQALQHAQSMWSMHVNSYKVLILLAHVEREKETLRGGSNLLPLLSSKFKQLCQELLNANKWQDEIKKGLEKVKGGRNLITRFWDWCTGRTDKLNKLIQIANEYASASSDDIKETIQIAQRLGQQGVLGRGYFKDGKFVQV